MTQNKQNIQIFNTETQNRHNIELNTNGNNVYKADRGAYW